ncbi:hypothetical protein M1563_02395 [Patescibacteria group bacterium]|nr:hypothetical protein [Patescibacteria group bacterium]
MNKLTFLLSIFLVLLMLIEKLYFLHLEYSFSYSLVAKLEYVSLIIIVLLICLSWWKKLVLPKDNRPITNSLFTSRTISLHQNKFSAVRVILIALITIVIALSIFINLTKKSLDGDGVTMYDARAKFLQAGYQFSNMNDLTYYNIQDKNYYLLYPPYTSIAHYFWYQANIPLPVSLIYSGYLILLAIGVFLLTQDFIGTDWGLFLTFSIVFNATVFLTAVSEQTYLPYSLYLVYGILLLARFLRDNLVWEFFCGVLLLALSQWIRFEELVWLGVTIAYFLTIAAELIKNLKRFFTKPIKTLLHYKIYFIYGLMLMAVSLLEYSSWRYFVHNIASTLSQSSFNYLYAPLNIIKDNELQHVINLIKFLIFSWGVSLFIFIASLFATTNTQGRHAVTRSMLFIKLVIGLSLLMYCMGLYGASFAGNWWEELNVSLLRSASYLIPLSYFLVFTSLKTFCQTHHWKTFVKTAIKIIITI